MTVFVSRPVLYVVDSRFIVECTVKAAGDSVSASYLGRP